MSDFVPGDVFPGIWEEILKRHWTYFDTEESIVKLEKRKKLEECLKEFLCMVHHESKFFLVETATVLENSIQNLDNFNAQKAITAFESISQYANNLFTKPWRKEFRILKMYSGFYQHEIKSSLLDAEILFEAMGYRRLSEDTLILDGPICPDQVTNVSRDAMTAYVELQIIKHIHTGLDAIGIKYSLLDIYRYREKYTGSASQAVKAIAFLIEEKRFRSSQKALAGDNYGYIDVQPSSNYFATSAHFCPAQCQCSLFQQAPQLSRHRLIAQPNAICCVPEHHKQQSSTKTNLVYSNISYPTQHNCPLNHNHHHSEIPSDSGGVLFPQMSHSRSLDHYSERVNHNNMLPHRHSFDHQQQGCTAHHQYHHSQQQQHYYQHVKQPTQNLYESPYDCIDGNSMGGGSSTISYAAVAANAATIDAGGGGVGTNRNLNSISTNSHPYNVSGNRFPLPINISNQLSAYDNLPSSNYSGLQEPTYALIPDPHMYSSVSKLPQNLVRNTNSASNVHGIDEGSIQRQRSCQSEQLINFEDTTILPPTTPQQQFGSLNKYRQNFEPSNHLMDKHYNMRNIMESPLPASATATCQQHCGPGKPSTNNDMYNYPKPTPKENRKENALSLREYPYNSADHGETTDISYESANDDFCRLPNGNDRNQQTSPTQFKKDQDGVGFSESWNYVYRTLEKNDHSKDLCERNDLLVQSLDLDSLNINNDTSHSQSSSVEKRRSYYIHQQLLESKPKSKALDHAQIPSNTNAKMENLVSTASSTNNIQKKKTSSDNNVKKMKSALKQTNTTSKSNTNVYKTQPKTNDNKTLSKTINNNNNNDLTNSGNGTMQRKKISPSLVNITKKSPSVASTNDAPPLSAENIAANEWSCSFCTFLNPDSKTICEICCRTKVCNLDSSTSSTDTGGTTIVHNMPTCA